MKSIFKRHLEQILKSISLKEWISAYESEGKEIDYCRIYISHTGAISIDRGYLE